MIQGMTNSIIWMGEHYLEAPRSTRVLDIMKERNEALRIMFLVTAGHLYLGVAFEVIVH